MTYEQWLAKRIAAVGVLPSKQEVWEAAQTAMLNDLESWIKEGEEKLNDERWSAMYHLGSWWADRPWRKR